MIYASIIIVGHIISARKKIPPLNSSVQSLDVTVPNLNPTNMEMIAKEIIVFLAGFLIGSIICFIFKDYFGWS